MRVLRLGHVQLAMPRDGESLARAFYQDALGITEIPPPPHVAKRGGCWFERGEVKIHLGVEADFRPARTTHPALLVLDLPALEARLRSFGYLIHDRQPLHGTDRIFVDDPFGNRIELVEFREGS